MTIPELYPCVLCGTEDPDVVVSLLEWADPVPAWAKGRWESLPRCRDRQACRDRSEAVGDEWPLEDRGATRPSVRLSICEDHDAGFHPNQHEADRCSSETMGEPATRSDAGADPEEVPAWL